MSITRKKLARIFAEELDRKTWGQVSPELFRYAADSKPFGNHPPAGGDSWIELLEVVADRLSGTESSEPLTDDELDAEIEALADP